MTMASRRQFETGATRDGNKYKPNYIGFLDPHVLQAFGAYMLKHQCLDTPDERPSDNWKQGIPQQAYIESLARHFLELWLLHEDPEADVVELEETLCAIMFNTMGYLREHIRIGHGLS